jgi:leucyl aminopeptidase
VKIVELLPAQRDARILQQRGALHEPLFTGQDAVIVACDAERATHALAQLPFADHLLKLYGHAQKQGPVAVLSTRVTGEAIPLIVVFIKPTASVFEQLTHAARAWKELAHSPRQVLFATCGMDEAHSGAALEALVAAALAGSASLPTLKSKPIRPIALETITLVRDGGPLDMQRTLAVDRGNHLARWLTTLPPNVLDSVSYRRALTKLAKQRRWGFTFFDEAMLKRAGAGAFLAVARANEHRGAGIVRLRYKAANRRGVSARLALVGKGICFDTGGINLKSHKSMYQMHEDMQGSAVAVGTLLALSELEVPFDIDCWLALTENEIGARAYRPQEVVRAANGVTIQVAHSDAEGRMVLADTLALAAREAPDLIIDYATLTGACVNALTERYSGAFTNRPQWREALELAGRYSGERVWTFPMDEDYDSDLNSTIADVLQCTPDSKGDHILAARFLNRFVPAEVPWIHLDLAASNRSGGLAHIPTDFTGFGVRYTTQLLLDHGLLGNRPAKKPTRQSATGKLAGTR